MRVRLVSLLGVGGASPPHYDMVTYVTTDGVRVESRFVQRALVEALAPSSVVLVGTEEARRLWVDTDSVKEEIRANCAFRGVPKGDTVQDRWKIFDTFSELLTPKALEELGESAPPEKIVLDVTHGFRIQPMLALSALNFVRAEAKRQSTTYPETLVQYGAYERGRTEAPIWDLTEVVSASSWSHAIEGLMRYGRADDFAALCREESTRANAAARANNAELDALKVTNLLKAVGNAARTFADDLSTGRTNALLTWSSRKLKELLSNEGLGEWMLKRPFLREPMTQLRAWVGELEADSPLTEKGLVAVARLAERYIHLQRYLEAAATIREGLVSKWALDTQRESASTTADFENSMTQFRKDDDNAWSNAVWKNDKDGYPNKDLTLGAEMQQARNDLEHVGYNGSPGTSGGLRDIVARLVVRFKALVDPD